MFWYKVLQREIIERYTNNFTRRLKQQCDSVSVKCFITYNDYARRKNKTLIILKYTFNCVYTSRTTVATHLTDCTKRLTICAYHNIDVYVCCFFFSSKGVAKRFLNLSKTRV